MADEPVKKPPADMATAVKARETRKLRARRETHRGIWFGLGMFGVVGWSVAVPTVVGVALGVWLDRAVPDVGFSWTLTLLAVGIALGCLNGWNWLKRERSAIHRHDEEDGGG